MVQVFHEAAQVLTVAGGDAPRTGAAQGDLGMVERGSVVVGDDGLLAWVGRSDALPASYHHAIRHDCRGKVLMPGLIDPHTHVVWAGDRKDEMAQRLAGADYAAILAEGGGILSSVAATCAATEAELVAQTLPRLQRMRRCGTTTLEMKSGYGLTLAPERRQLRAAATAARTLKMGYVRTCMAAHALPPDVRDHPKLRAQTVDYIVHTILPSVHAEGLAEFVDVFCEQGAFTVEETRAIFTAAQTLGFGLRVHANEFGHSGGAQLAAQLRIFSADHLLDLNDAERAALAHAGVTAVLLPGTSLVLGKPFADGRALVQAGVPVAIASDCNPGSCALESQSLMLALACFGNRLQPEQAVVAATHNAAASLGLAHRVGSLMVGKQADILVLGTPDYRDLVYHGGSPLIDEVWIGGARVV